MTTERKKRSPTIRIAFTKQAIAALKPSPAGRYYAFDARTRGLAVMVTDQGTKTFYIVRRVAGRPQRIRIAGCDELTVEQARTRAQSLIGDIAKGADPLAEKREARQQVTFEDAFKHYIDVYAKAHCREKSWIEDKRIHVKHLADLDRRSLATLTTGEIAKLHVGIGESSGHYMANRVLEVIRKVLNHARVQLGWKQPNPCEGIAKFREQGRERFLDAGEVHRLLETLKRDDVPADVRDYVLLLLATGGRRSNVERMKWADLDLDKGVWRVGADESKSGEPMSLILPKPAVELLKRRPKTDSQFVFPPNGPSLRYGWERVRETAGLLDVRCHDLRRTVGAWLATSGATELIIAKALGHRSTRSTAVYARLSDDVVRRNVEATSAALLTGATELAAPKRKRRKAG